MRNRNLTYNKGSKGQLPWTNDIVFRFIKKYVFPFDISLVQHGWDIKVKRISWYSYLLSDILFCFCWSTCPRSARSLRNFISWASTLSLSLFRRSLSAWTRCCRASCSFRYLNRCSLAASSWCCDSICACCRHAISRSSLSVNWTPSGSCKRKSSLNIAVKYIPQDLEYHIGVIRIRSIFFLNWKTSHLILY